MRTRPGSRREVPLASRSEAFARLFEAVHEGVFIGTLAPVGAGRGGATLASNAHLKLIFGYPPETREKDVTPFAADHFCDVSSRTSFIERLANDGSVTDYLLRMRRVNGEVVWVEVTARTDAPHAKSGMRVEALVRDVSERKKLDDQSRDLYQQLLQAEKMAALGQTISGVAHELNNPLADDPELVGATLGAAARRRREARRGGHPR